MIRHAPSIGIGIGLSLRSQGFGVSYVKAGRVLDYSTQVGPFTIVDKSGEGNTATLYSGRGLMMDAVNDTVTYATGYSLGSQTATVWMRVDTLGTRALGSTAGGGFLFTPTATGVWEELTYTRSNIEGDLLWLAGSDCDIGDLRVGTEHWTHNDWSDPTGDTSNGKTIVDSGPNQLHGTCTGCSGFTGEGIDPEVAGIVGYDDAQWFNGVDTFITAATPVFPATADFDETFEIYVGNLTAPASYLYYFSQVATSNTLGLAISPTSGLITFVVGGPVAIQAATSHYGEHITVRLTRVGTTFEMLINGVSEGTYVSSNSIDQVATVFGKNSALTGREVTGLIYGDSVTGTPSGSFLTVGQKRATIPQTADKNWNKYIGLGGAEQGAVGYSTFTPVPYGFDGTLASGVGIAGFTLPATAQIGDSFKICVDITSDQSPSCQFRPNAGSASVASNSVLLSVGHNEITLTLTAAGNFVSVSEGDSPSTITVRNFTAELISGTAQASVMVSATDANIQIDALGTAIGEPRLNTQQLNLFGDGEYSRTPDSDSLDLTTTATWEVWGNFYGVTARNQTIISKQDGGASKQSFALTRAAPDPAGELRIVTSSTGTTVAVSKVTGLTDSINHVVITHDGATWASYVDGIATTITGTTPVSSLYVNDVPVSLGARPFVGVYGNFSPFKIGSAKIYNTALTADEVLTNYNTQKSLYGL